MDENTLVPTVRELVWQEGYDGVVDALLEVAIRDYGAEMCSTGECGPKARIMRRLVGYILDASVYAKRYDAID